MRINKRAQEGSGLSMNAIIIIVLIVVVIAAVFVFLFKGDIMRYISNLPGYSLSNEDRQVDVSKLPADSPLRGRALCPIPLGDVRTSRDWTYFGTTSYIYLNGKATNLIWNSGSKIIDLDEWGNEEIGKIDSYDGVSIGAEWLTPEMQKAHSGLPSAAQLKSLDGAYKLWGGNKICRQTAT